MDRQDARPTFQALEKHPVDPVYPVKNSFFAIYVEDPDPSGCSLAVKKEKPGEAKALQIFVRQSIERPCKLLFQMN